MGELLRTAGKAWEQLGLLGELGLLGRMLTVSGMLCRGGTGMGNGTMV